MCKDSEVLYEEDSRLEYVGNFHKFQVQSCDLIMLQEHHLDASKIQSYYNMLHGDWRYYWIPAHGQSVSCMYDSE